MKIFIQIASYRDPQLVLTVKDAIDKAKKPKNLVFSIARQFHPDDKFDDLSEYQKDKRFKILDIPYQDSQGVCWARNLTQQLYDGEEYTMQIDSHMRFALRSGADAICEKPLVLNPWNIDALKEVENQYGKKVYNILQLRLHPSIIALKKKIENGPKRRSVQ